MSSSATMEASLPTVPQGDLMNDAGSLRPSGSGANRTGRRVKGKTSHLPPKIAQETIGARGEQPAPARADGEPLLLIVPNDFEIPVFQVGRTSEGSGMGREVGAERWAAGPTGFHRLRPSSGAGSKAAAADAKPDGALGLRPAAAALDEPVGGGGCIIAKAPLLKDCSKSAGSSSGGAEAAAKTKDEEQKACLPKVRIYERRDKCYCGEERRQEISFCDFHYRTVKAGNRMVSEEFKDRRPPLPSNWKAKLCSKVDKEKPSNTEVRKALGEILDPSWEVQKEGGEIQEEKGEQVQQKVEEPSGEFCVAVPPCHKKVSGKRPYSELVSGMLSDIAVNALDMQNMGRPKRVLRSIPI